MGLQMYNHTHKQMRPFQIIYGTPDAEYNHTDLAVMARSSLEAGSKIIGERIIPAGYVLKELLDPAGAT